MYFEEFTAEIKDSMKQYAFAGMIDDMRIHDWVVMALKQFRNLHGMYIETTINVKGGRAKLPTGYISLEEAYKCEPHVYTCDDDSKDILQDVYFYKIKETTISDWNQCNPCEVENISKCVVEKIYLHNGKKANFYYKNPMRLKLMSHVKNRTPSKSNIHSISVNGQYLYTNFDKGTVFIRYKGLDVDDNDMIIIPETERGYMIKYLSYMVKRTIMEEMMGNSDNITNESTLYGLYSQKEEEFYSKTETELKFKGIERGIRNYGKRVKSEFNVYNI